MTAATYISHSAEETVAYGKLIAAQLTPNSVICFFGDLGAGKTTLIKGIIASLTKIKEENVLSPTFVYLQTYPGSVPVYHFDLYRLHNPDEFFAMGFDETFDAGGITCIEWSERIAVFLPPRCIKISIEYLDEDIRQINVQGLA